ncbi:PH domain-containing protein [Geosporobacter ferrireducens]|uniref:SHOCT domain-containing protein n=1 Tax=Geosporobacter ferrireducens TaxID=1424294 RepID=A0A1D8GPI9_9FIRM|nr:PH domain-containing protein [Geosporobacter ferrireducens]AOT72797.1 hypothetical protein Gferi_26510 [Geosporobacter ferrireducens]
MSLFNKLKKATEDIKKTLDDANIMEKAKGATDTIKSKVDEVSSKLSKSKTETLIVKGKKEYWLNHLPSQLEKESFKNISVNNNHQIEAKYSKIAMNAGGRGNIKISFVDLDGENTKATIEISVAVDTATSMQVNYKNIYEAVRKSFGEDAIVAGEEFKGIYDDVVKDRQDKIQDLKDNGLDKLKFQSAEKKQELEAQERMAQVVLSEKIDRLEHSINGGQGIIAKYPKGKLTEFTKEFYEKLCMPGTKWEYTKLSFHPYITDKAITKVKSSFATDLDEKETPLVLYAGFIKEGFLITDKHIYFRMKEKNISHPYKGKIDINMIHSMKVKELSKEGTALFLNNEQFFYIDTDSNSYDALNLKKYLDKLNQGDFHIPNQEISAVLEEKIEPKLLNRIKGFLYEDEYILYLAFGLDSITARDWVVCTTQRLVLINREMFGLSEQIKQFEYENITSISTAKSTDAGLLTDLLATAFKQCDLEIYVAGSNFRIETLNRIEAERVIKVVNEYRRKSKAAPVAASREEGRSQGEDILAQIEKLANLKNNGILTEEEFQSKKSELLAKL